MPRLTSGSVLIEHFVLLCLCCKRYANRGLILRLRNLRNTGNRQESWTRRQLIFPYLGQMVVNRESETSRGTAMCRPMYPAGGTSYQVQIQITLCDSTKRLIKRLVREHTISRSKDLLNTYIQYVAVGPSVDNSSVEGSNVCMQCCLSMCFAKQLKFEFRTLLGNFINNLYLVL